MTPRQGNGENPFKQARMIVPFISIITLLGCATVKPGPYEISAYDGDGRVVRTIVALDSRALSVSMNGMCIAYPKSRLVVRSQNDGQMMERQC